MINYLQPMPTQRPTWYQKPREGKPWCVTCYNVKDGHTATDATLNSIQYWSSTNRCGNRTSYDVWEFKTEQDMMRFLLRWA